MSNGRWLMTVTLWAIAVVAVGCTRTPVSIEISPATSLVAAGETVEFSANSVGVPAAELAWSATAGTISGSGATAVFTAPYEEGEVVVEARHPDHEAFGSATVTVEIVPVVTDAVTNDAGVAAFTAQGLTVRVLDATSNLGVSGVSVSLLEFASQTVIQATSSDGSYLPALTYLDRPRATPGTRAGAAALTSSTVIMVPRSTQPPPYWVYLVLPPSMWVSLIYEAVFCGTAPLGELAEKLAEQASGISMPDVEFMLAAIPFDLGISQTVPRGVISAGHREELAGATVETALGVEGAIVASALAAYSLAEYAAANVNDRIVGGYLEVYDADQPIRYCTTPTGGVVYVTVHPTDPPAVEPTPLRFELTQTPGGIAGEAVQGTTFEGSFELENTGNAPIQLVGVDTDAAWAAASPSTAMPLAPGDAIEVTVSFDAAGLAPGSYAGKVTTTWTPEGGGTVGTALVTLSFAVTASTTPPPPAVTLAAPVIGYGDAVDRPVSATAHDDARTVLAAGTLRAGAGARVDGSLTPLAAVPSGAFSDGFFGEDGPPPGCSVTVQPAGLRAVGFQVLDVGEGASHGVMVLANFNLWLDAPSAVGQRTHTFVLANAAGRVAGFCPASASPFGQTITYDVDLVAGWNLIAIEIDGVDAIGAVTDIVFRDATPGADAAWYYSGW